MNIHACRRVPVEREAKAGYTLAAWRERGVSAAWRERGVPVSVAFSTSLHTRNVSGAALLLLLLLALSGHMYVSH